MTSQRVTRWEWAGLGLFLAAFIGGMTWWCRDDAAWWYFLSILLSAMLLSAIFLLGLWLKLTWRRRP